MRFYIFAIGKRKFSDIYNTAAANFGREPRNISRNIFYTVLKSDIIHITLSDLIIHEYSTTRDTQHSCYISYIGLLPADNIKSNRINA